MVRISEIQKRKKKGDKELEEKIQKRKKTNDHEGGERETLSEREIDEIQEATLLEQRVLAHKYKKQNPDVDADHAMALDSEMIQSYRETTKEEARKDDHSYFKDGEFHGDEQKEKTAELIEAAFDTNSLEGLYDPEDPGFAPPILYKNETGKPKQPVHRLAVSRKAIGVDAGKLGGRKKGGKAPPAKKEGGEGEGASSQVEKIKEFFVFPLTWDQFGTDWTIILLGKRRAGKTCFIRGLCGNYLRPFFPRVYVFTKSFYSGEYAEFVPEAHIFAGMGPDETDENGAVIQKGGLTALKEIYAIQKEYKKRSKKGSFHGNMNCLIIIDDCLSDGFRYQELIDEVFFEGRHMNICFIVTSQDFKGINPACTGNADAAIQFRCRSERDKEAVRTKFCDFFKNDEEYEELTGPVLRNKWHCMAYFQDKPHIDPEFTMFCGRPIEPPPFVMGAKAWWRNNPKQLFTITEEHPELKYLLETDDWGVMGEEEFNEALKNLPTQ